MHACCIHMYHFCSITDVSVLPQMKHNSREVHHQLTKPQQLRLLQLMDHVQGSYSVEQSHIAIHRAELVTMN